MTHFLCPKLVSYFKSHVNPMIPPSKRISGSTIGTNLLSCKIMVALSASTNTSKWLNAHCDCDILTLNWEKAALRAIPHTASFNRQCRWGPLEIRTGAHLRTQAEAIFSQKVWYDMNINSCVFWTLLFCCFSLSSTFYFLPVHYIYSGKFLHPIFWVFKSKEIEK